MNIERRSDLRHTFEMNQGGRLSALLGNKPVEILQLQDGSPFGAGLLLHGAVKIGDHIRLHYLLDRVEVVVDGEVVWGAQADGGFRVGIYFNAEDASENVRLFNAIAT